MSQKDPTMPQENFLTADHTKQPFDHPAFFHELDICRLITMRVLPSLLKGRDPVHPIRLWIPYCHAGDKVWPIAICLLEYWQQHGIKTPLKIFATDPNERAIDKARKGFYDKTFLSETPDRFMRFFERTAGGCRIVRAARELCIFARHDLLKDPPFPSIDIICCDTTLFPPGSDARKKVMRLFHYALKPSGFFLPRETLTAADSQFSQSPDDWRIYIRTGAAGSWLTDIPFPKQPNAHPKQPADLPPVQPTPAMAVKAGNMLLSHYVPSCILVNKELQIIRFYGSRSPFLRPSPGKTTLNLLKMLRDELVFELHHLAQHVKSTGQAIKKKDILLPDNETSREITMEVIPVRSAPGDGLMLVIIRENADPAAFGPGASHVKSTATPRSETRVDALKIDLREARQQMLSMSDAFEHTRQELQVVNEELLAANEELQCINAELEASKEDLQAANEQLLLSNNGLHLGIVESIPDPLLALDGHL